MTVTYVNQKHLLEGKNVAYIVIKIWYYNIVSAEYFSGLRSVLCIHSVNVSDVMFVFFLDLSKSDESMNPPLVMLQ